MKRVLAVGGLTLGTSLTYAGIGQLLPQLENHPPAVVELGSGIGPEDLATAGAGVFQANCAQCHALGQAGGRCPDLARVGTEAAARARSRAEATGEAYTSVDYLVESLCRPGAYVVGGFPDIMPPQGRVLTGGQVLAAVAFLQEQGGVATVKGADVAPVERFGCSPGAAGSAQAGAPEPVGPPEQVLATFGCGGCHDLKGGNRQLGPPLSNVGARLDASEIYQAILDPDATLAEGDPPYPGGLMKATLDANGFYDRMTAADYRALVAWLAAQRGEGG